MKMVKTLSSMLLIATASIMTALAQDTGFKVCKSTYALCTTAVCNPTENEKKAACKCDVRTGEYSLGTKACDKVKKPAPGDTIKSRYYPIKSFVGCSNDRQWANCLDATCKVDSNSTTATCSCELAPSTEPYVITTDTYTSNTCTTGIISSATVQSVFQVTEFLKSNENLQPFDFKVLNVQSK